MIKIVRTLDTNPSLPDRIAMLSGNDDSVQRANKMITDLIMEVS